VTVVIDKVTVNNTPLLTPPLVVTTTLPVVAAIGTTATIEVLLQLWIEVAVAPLNVTVLVPCVEPKFVPVIVTAVPTAPEAGERPVVVGGERMVNNTPLLTTPLTVTTTFPVAAPEGTIAAIDVALHLVIEVAAVPLNVTALLCCDAPKFVPVIVTEEPTTPEVGDRLVIAGVPRTVNAEPALATPPTVTTTLPVVAPVGTTATIDVTLQLVMVAVVPLNITVLVPCVAPKLVPVIVTEELTAPEVGERLLIVGVERTVNNTPLLATPFTVTTTLPVAAPVGTVATIDVALQLVIEVAAVPLNFTVLVPCVAPKFVPVIVTEEPTAPEVGDRLVIAAAVPTTTCVITLETITPLPCTIA
jgi:hypothetical protein